MERIWPSGCGLAVATRGAQGALLYDGREFYTQPSDYVEPVDTMGAGTPLPRPPGPSDAGLESGGQGAGSGGNPDRGRGGRRFSAQRCLEPGAFGHGRSIPAGYQMHIVTTP